MTRKGTKGKAEAAEGAPRFCHRHPTRSARRKCFHCARALCPECQVRHAGHIFCSHRCARSQGRRERWERLLAWNRTALAGRWFRVALFLGLLAAAAGLILLSLNLHWIVPYPTRESSIPGGPRAKFPGTRMETPDWTSPGPVVVSSPRSGTVARTNRIAVEGAAPPEAMVGLYVNEERVAVLMALEGKWKFEDVPLTASYNTLQARYFDHQGNTSFSKTTVVRLEVAPAKPPAPVPTVPEGVILASMGLVRAPQGKRQVLLTFDGGSNANATPQILQALRRHGIRATIFLTGEYIQRYPEFVRQIAQDRHVVGNHTYSHPHLTSYSFNGHHATLAGVSQGFLREQLHKTEEAYRAVAGRPMDSYWRAPFGEGNRDIVAWAAQAGYRHVYWTPKLDSLDWVADPSNPLYKGPEQILKGILGQADRAPGGVDGGIILMHLGTERDGEDEAHLMLEPLVGQLRERGYSFVDVASAWPWEPSK